MTTFRQPAFQFSIRHPPYANPPGRIDQFARTLRDEAILAAGLECFFGALGGSACTYGVVWRDSGSVTIEDRDRIEAWIKAQQILADVTFGELEELDGTDVMREFNAKSFDVDNLTDDDRRAAAEYEAALKKRLSKFVDRSRSTE